MSRLRVRQGAAIVATAMLLTCGPAMAGTTTTGAPAATRAQQAAALCRSGDALRARKQGDAARRAYVDAVRADPAVAAAKGCAQLGFAALDAKVKVEDPCAVADALQAARQEAEAKAEYIKILKDDPAAQCASDALTERGWFAATTAWLDDAADKVLDVLKWLAVLAGVLAVAGLGLARTMWGRKWLVRYGWIDHLLAPRVALSAIADGGAAEGAGAAVTALVRDEMTAAANAAPVGPAKYRLDRLSVDDGFTKAVDAVGEVNPSFKAMAAVLGLVQWLLPRARLTASGTLQGAGPRGEGAALQLEGGAAPAATTLWLGPAPAKIAAAAEGADGPAKGSEYQALAVPIGAWVGWQIGAALSPDAPVGDPRTIALFKGAEAAERRGEDAVALRLYGEVLAIDADHVSARVNHANLRARHREEYRDAVAELHLAVMILRYAP
jgi:tetratricopeptide (TPR) repeat protein